MLFSPHISTGYRSMEKQFNTASNKMNSKKAITTKSYLNVVFTKICNQIQFGGHQTLDWDQHVKNR